MNMFQNVTVMDKKNSILIIVIYSDINIWCMTMPEVSLLYVQATWNMSMLQTQDLMKSAQASLERKSPKEVHFSKL